MSFTVNIYYTGQNGSAKDFANEMVSSGVVDRWDNQVALDTHHKSPMMQEVAKPRDKYNLHMHVEQFVERPKE